MTPNTALASAARDKVKATRPLNVAIVDEELPFPPTSGKRIRTLNLLGRLAPRHRLTYLCHRNPDPSEARRAVEYFADLGIRTVVVERPVPPKKGVGFYLRLAANLFSALPYSVASHTSRALREALADHARGQVVDLWHCEWTPYAESLQGPVHRPRLVVAHNVESVIWRRYYETETNLMKRWFIRGQWHKFERFERRVLSEVEWTVVVSAVDAVRCRDDFSAGRVAVVEKGSISITFALAQSRASRISSCSWAASTGGPTWTASACCWSASFPRCVPGVPRPRSRWSAVTRRTSFAVRRRPWPASSCSPTWPTCGRIWRAAG